MKSEEYNQWAIDRTFEAMDALKDLILYEKEDEPEYECFSNILWCGLKYFERIRKNEKNDSRTI